MMSGQLEQIITYFASSVSLPVFALVAPFFEEVIPPIPSPSILMVAGFLASVQGWTVLGLVGLAIISACSKTTGAFVLYCIVDKVEDILSTRLGKFIGVTHEDIEKFGSRLGRGARDYWILFILRALPIVPSTFVSAGSGLLKVNKRLFLITTFAGSIVRGFLYIYVGYVGTGAALALVEKTATAESFIGLGAGLVIVLFLSWLYYRRRKKAI